MMNLTPLSININQPSSPISFPSASPSLSTFSPLPFTTPQFDEQITIFSHLIIEEFLIRKNMVNTLTNFRQEWNTRPSDHIANLSWMNIALKLHLPQLIIEEKDEDGKKKKTIIEHINTLLINNSALRMRNQPEVLATGLANLSKMKSTTSSQVMPPIPPLSPSQQPGSLSVSDEGSGNIKKNSENQEKSVDHQDKSNKSNPSPFESERSLPKYKMKTIGNILANKYSLHSPIRREHTHQSSSSSSSSSSLQQQLSPHSQSHSQHQQQQQQQQQHSTDINIHQPRKLRKKLLPIVSKPSNENWIPEVIRFRSIHRELATLESNLKSSLILENELNRELRSLQIDELDREHLKEELGVIKKQACGCCLQLYTPINLLMTIPRKAIIDIRKKWSGNISGWWTHEDERIEKMSKCYEGIKICCFCTQFFHHQESYRPSYDLIKQEAQLESMNERRRIEQERWDPLKRMEKDRKEMKAPATTPEETKDNEMNGSLVTGIPFDFNEIRGITTITLE